MAKHVWSVVCDEAIIDSGSRKISLIGVIEKLSVQAESEQALDERLAGADGIAQRFRIASWWVRSNYDIPEEHFVRTRWRFPSGETLDLGGPASLRLMTTHSTRLLLDIAGVPWRGPGLYWIEVQGSNHVGDEKWKTAAELPFEVVVNTTQPALEKDR